MTGADVNVWVSGAADEQLQHAVEMSELLTTSTTVLVTALIIIIVIIIIIIIINYYSSHQTAKMPDIRTASTLSTL